MNQRATVRMFVSLVVLVRCYGRSFVDSFSLSLRTKIDETEFLFRFDKQRVNDKHRRQIQPSFFLSQHFDSESGFSHRVERWRIDRSFGNDQAELGHRTSTLGQVKRSFPDGDRRPTPIDASTLSAETFVVLAKETSSSLSSRTSWVCFRWFDRVRFDFSRSKNERRHLGFKVFVDSLDEKRSSNIRRYQKELRDYLLNRLETDRLKQELGQLTHKFVGQSNEVLSIRLVSLLQESNDWNRRRTNIRRSSISSNDRFHFSRTVRLFNKSFLSFDRPFRSRIVRERQRRRQNIDSSLSNLGRDEEFVRTARSHQRSWSSRSTRRPHWFSLSNCSRNKSVDESSRIFWSNTTLGWRCSTLEYPNWLIRCWISRKRNRSKKNNWFTRSISIDWRFVVAVR